MPEDEMLDAISLKISGLKFNQLIDPQAKARVIELAIGAEINDTLLDVGDWFRKSKLFEGLR